MTDAKYLKPIPIPQQEADFYWEKTKQHELWFRKCNSCSGVYFYPRDICPSCFSRNTTWTRSSGKGSIFTFAIVHRASIPAFRDDSPYVVAIVELEEGPKMPTNIVNIEPDPTKVRVGMPVEVLFEDISDEISLPKFQPIL
jgi:uncharacterized OB-fold protein